MRDKYNTDFKERKKDREKERKKEGRKEKKERKREKKRRNNKEIYQPNRLLIVIQMHTSLLHFLLALRSFAIERRRWNTFTRRKKKKKREREKESGGGGGDGENKKYITFDLKYT